MNSWQNGNCPNMADQPQDGSQGALPIINSTPGNLDQVERIVKVTGYVNVAPGFVSAER